MGLFLANFSLRMGQFSNPVATHPRTNEVVQNMNYLILNPPDLQPVSWSLAEFRHNKIVQSPHENYFNVCRQHKEK